MDNNDPEVNVMYDDPKEQLVKCHVGSCLETDWCQADAARESLREHMKLLKEARERITYLESLRMNEIVIGDRMVDIDGARGTVLSTGLWNEKILKAGLAGKWCQIIIRPITY